MVKDTALHRSRIECPLGGFLTLAVNFTFADPSAQKKRSHASTDEVSCPSLSHSAEHTPRKSPKRQT